MNVVIARIKPSYNKVIEANRDFVEIFMSSVATKYKCTFLTMMQNPSGQGYAQPLVSAVLSNVHDIIKATAMEGNVVSENDVAKFCEMFLDIKEITLAPSLYYIPKFNLYHYGNICHLNTCILMLSSLYYFLEAFEPKTHAQEVLKTLLLSSYSPIDINPCALFELIKILEVNIATIEPAEETMYKIVKLFAEDMPLDIFLHWDFAHSIDTDASINDIVNKYAPTYLVMNAQDFSVALGVEQNNQFVPVYNSGEHTYKLASVIVYHSMHFVNVFVNNDGAYEIRDDLCHRHTQPTLNIGSLGRRLQITEVCYAKIK